ncbi:hypothetical protein Hanom_Chr02g00144481 [Helianthus anomalus]
MNHTIFLSFVLICSYFIDWDGQYFRSTSALAICLRTNDTGDFNYAFEFIWTKHSNYVILLEAILLTLKKCLPRFKFAFGAEIGDELDVILVENSTDDEDDEIVESSTDDEGDQIVESSTHDEDDEIVESSTHDEDDEIGETKKFKISRKKIITDAESTRKGKETNGCGPHSTFKGEVQDNSNRLSVSTVKQILRKNGIKNWPGPTSVKRKKANDSSVIQIDTNERDNGSIQEPSTININKK